MARQAARKAERDDPAAAGPGQVKLGWLGGTVGYYLRTAQEAAFEAFARRANGADARPWRFAILALIDANPGITQGDLAAAIRRKTSSLTPSLDQLVRQGCVIRARAQADRRAYALTLTAKGKASMQALLASAVEHERDLDRLVGRENRADFIRILRRIAEGLAQKPGRPNRGERTE